MNWLKNWIAHLMPRFVDESVGMSPRTVDAVGALMLRAAAAVEARGHCKFSLEDAEGRICTARALMLGAENELWGEDHLAAEKRFERFVKDGICSWNNFVAKDTAHVASTLRRAAHA